MLNILNAIFYIPILNILILLYSGFAFIKFPYSFGFAIIFLTVIIRTLLQPFFNQQMQTARKMQDIKPEMDAIVKKYKGDKKALQQAQLKLYQQAGINPAAGCLFMVVQIPVFIGLYQVLLNVLQNGSQAKAIAEINKDLYFSAIHISSIDPNFFGLNLAISPSTAGNPLYFLVPAVTALLQYYQVKVSTPQTQPNVKAIEKKSDTGADFQKAMSTQMKYIFPLLIGWFAYTLPVGLSLYWNVFSLFSIIQYRNLNKEKK